MIRGMIYLWEQYQADRERQRMIGEAIARYAAEHCPAGIAGRRWKCGPWTWRT